MSLRDWGWDEEWAAAFAAHAAEGLRPARVARQDRGGGEVRMEEDARTAEPSGRFRRAVESGAADVPVAGDWVAVDPRAGCARAGIEAALPRRTCLARQDAGRAMRRQALAANVDVAFLACALDDGRGFNLRRLERALALVRAGGAEPVVVLNKADLCDDVAGRVREAQFAAPDVPVLAASATEGWGVEELASWLAGGRTGVLLGPSGVGKSALANALLGEARQATRPVPALDARGRHATTRRELFRLPTGGWLIDTAGLREFQPWDAAVELDGVFPEVAELAGQCRFRNCRHEGEPGCAVQLALGEGRLDLARFDHYLRLRGEQAYQERRREVGARMAEKERWRPIAQRLKQMRRDKE